MTALPGREVDANLLRGAAPGSAQPRPDAQDAGGQDLGDLVEALGRGHQIRTEGVRQERDCLIRCGPAVWRASTSRAPVQWIASDERTMQKKMLDGGGRLGLANMN